MKKISKKPQKIFGIAVLTVVLFLAFSPKALASQTLNITPEEVIKMVNDSRQAGNLEALTVNEKLSQAAQAKVEDMLKENYFAHDSPSGKTPWFWIERTGYDYRYAGENLAMDFKSVQEQHVAWMTSLTHKKNILNSNFREIGVAVKQGFIEGHLAIITVQEFGTPMSFMPASLPKKVSSPQTQLAGEEEKSDLRSIPILDKELLQNDYLSPKLNSTDWLTLAFITLQTLIILIISLINPIILVFLVVQSRNFKSPMAKKLELKEQAS
ncbi:MAG: CAP domain-containing protein [Candidatus Moraniibacteriota bacterium]